MLRKRCILLPLNMLLSLKGPEPIQTCEPKTQIKISHKRFSSQKLLSFSLNFPLFLKKHTSSTWLMFDSLNQPGIIKFSQGPFKFYIPVWHADRFSFQDYLSLAYRRKVLLCRPPQETTDTVNFICLSLFTTQTQNRLIQQSLRAMP